MDFILKSTNLCILLEQIYNKIGKIKENQTDLFYFNVGSIKN